MRILCTAALLAVIAACSNVAHGYLITGVGTAGLGGVSASQKGLIGFIRCLQRCFQRIQHAGHGTRDWAR